MIWIGLVKQIWFGKGGKAVRGKKKKRGGGPGNIARMPVMQLLMKVITVMKAQIRGLDQFRLTGRPKGKKGGEGVKAVQLVIELHG